MVSIDPKNMWNNSYTTNYTTDMNNILNEISTKLNELYKKDTNKSEKPVVKIKMPKIKNIDFQPPLTVVVWEDGTKTFVKCSAEEEYDPEKGAAMAIAKKALGSGYNFIETINYYTEKYYKKHSEVERSFKLSATEKMIIWFIRKCGRNTEKFIEKTLTEIYLGKKNS